MPHTLLAPRRAPPLAAWRPWRLQRNRSMANWTHEVPSPLKSVGGEGQAMRSEGRSTVLHRRWASCGCTAGRKSAIRNGTAAQDRSMAGFSGFDPVIRRLGGIASRRELREAGWSETDLWFAWQYGNLDRIRIGWYAASDLPADARAAWAAGGPLACVSAMVHHGMLEASALPDEQPLHIALPAGGRRPRGAPSDLVVHWSDRDRHSGTRQAVAPAVALRQARRCQPALAALAAPRAASARAAAVSRSRIQSGTAAAAMPSARNPATSGSSASSTSQASSRPPCDRGP